MWCRSKNDLSKQLTELKGELLTLRVQKIAGGNAAKLTRMYVAEVLRFVHTAYDSVFRAATLSASRLLVSSPS